MTAPTELEELRALAERADELLNGCCRWGSGRWRADYAALLAKRGAK